MKAGKFLNPFVCVLVLAAGFLLSYQKPKPFPAPVNEMSEEERDYRREHFIELIHSAAPGVSWRKIEADNAWNNYLRKQGLINAKTTTVFANGTVTGDWFERGNDNQAGRMSSVAYVPTGNKLYAMSDGGTLWKKQLSGGSWILLNDDVVFHSRPLEVTTTAPNATRLLMVQNGIVVYSDNEGATVQQSTGFNFPIAWGGNSVYDIRIRNDAVHTVLVTTLEWDPVVWAPRVFLYKSTDNGTSFTRIYGFTSYESDQVSMFSVYNNDQFYIIAVNPQAPDSVFQFNAGALQYVTTTSSFTTANKCVLQGGIYSSQLKLYAMIDNNTIYESTNTGLTWQFVSTLPTTSWGQFASSALSPSYLMYGEVEAYRSNNAGTGFTKVNNWGDYYANPASKLHADIQVIRSFRDSVGNEFWIVGTDGGVYHSSNNLNTVANQGLAGLRVNQLWDHISAPGNPDILFSGTQDQGMAHTTNASGTGIINQDQLISGDYGQMRITANNTLWMMYPGTLYIFRDMNNPNYQTSYTIPGTQVPNYGWMPATAMLGSSLTQDEILLGGGEISGAGGSHLIKLNCSTVSPYTITETQFNYDFRANSNSNNSGIAAIAVSALNANVWFTATEDGTFFYSYNAGGSWQKAAAFTGPAGMWLYGSSILPSADSLGTVYLAGSGYSNPPVYVSHDTGKTFIPMSNGLPPTLVNKIAGTALDSLIFAATDAGPYVYVKSQQQWFSLMDVNTPTQAYRGIEFLPSINTARFSTYGRGIWDFRMPLPTTGFGQPVVSKTIIYPNPVKSGEYLRIKGDAATISGVRIYALNGLLVATGSISAAEPFLVKDLQPGYYIYTLTDHGAASGNGTLVIVQ